MFEKSIMEIDASELAQWVNDATQNLRIIDVRQMREIAMGTVPRAEPLPLNVLPANINELPREGKLVIVCHSGARSAQACMFLQQMGFSNVYNLRGGMVGWAQSGFPAHHPA